MRTGRSRRAAGRRGRVPPLTEAILLHLDRVAYDEAWALQRRLHRARVEGRIPDVLLLLEHPHVFTIGRQGDPAEVLAAPDRLRQLGAAVVRTDRGGRVTYHGPGQSVGYLIVDLAPRGGDVGQLVRDVEAALIRAVGRFGVPGGRIAGLPGVWVGGSKLAAVGMRVARGVTMHGFALNRDPDLALFAEIIPCGIADRGVTSLAALGAAPARAALEAALAESCEEVFGWRLRPPSPAEAADLGMDPESRQVGR